MKSTLYIVFLLIQSRNVICDTKSDLSCDFIIIGSGSGGAAVAGRLSEIPKLQVCVFEAGGEADKILEIPYKLNKTIPSVNDWQFKSEPQKKCCQNLKDKITEFPRGKVLGGTSTINNQGHTRGSRKDYDIWETMGNKGWGYKDVLPFFIYLEEYLIPQRREEKPYYGSKGPIPASQPFYRTPLAYAWLKAGMELGYSVISPNAKDETGFFYPATTTKDGLTYNSYKGYLQPYEKTRSNLTIYNNTLVTKILFDEQKRAIGVEYLKNGQKKNATAKKEVILAAGVIQSPQLLMLSGIGPRDTLQKFKIPIIKEIPGVGQNFLNHMSTLGLVYTIEQKIAFKKDRDYTKENLNLLYFNHSGPLAVTEKHEGKAFLKTSTDDDALYPDIEVKLISSESPNWGVPEEEFKKNLGPFDDRDNINIIPIMLHPKSKGNITIQSNNIEDYPIIEPNLFDDPQDVQTVLKAIKIAHSISQTKAFQQYGTKYHGRQPEGCEKYETFSDDYWMCIIIKYSYAFHHPVGTCKMGPVTDKMSVVDARLRVHGVSNLRVIDASIMPYIISGHTSIPTIMIGEKGAYMIKEDHRLPLPKLPKVNLNPQCN